MIWLIFGSQIFVAVKDELDLGENEVKCLLLICYMEQPATYTNIHFALGKMRPKDDASNVRKDLERLESLGMIGKMMTNIRGVYFVTPRGFEMIASIQRICNRILPSNFVIQNGY